MNYHIMILGDFLPTPNNYSEFELGEIETIFGSAFCDLAKRTDYIIANMEGPLTNCNDPIAKSGPSIKAPISTVKGIKDLGITCLALANNHIMDYGEEGIRDTLYTLENNGIEHIGAGLNRFSINTYTSVLIGTYRVVIYNVAETEFNIPDLSKPGVNLFEEYRVCREIEKLKEENDYIIVLYHGGAEKFRYPTPNLRRRFHLIADCGADMVIAQHSHCIGSQEIYNNCTLLYGQGNFCFSRIMDDYTSTGLAIDLSFSEKSFENMSYIKVCRRDAFIEIDKDQDISEFWKRSNDILQEGVIESKYREYCKDKLDWYLSLFRRSDLIDRVLNKLFYNDLNIYRRDALLAAINLMRCEVHQENFLNSLVDLYSDLYGKL